MQLLNDITVIFLTGLVIKLMDDYLDQEIDRLNNRSSLAIKLQRGIVPYSLILISFAVLINYRLTISLFWSSYIVGMGIDNDNLPTGLKSYQEVLIMLVLGFVVLDYKLFLFALMIILFVQLVDDYIDFHLEEYLNQTNYLNYLGEVGTILLAVISLLIALWINWQRSILVISITPIIIWLVRR